MLAPLAITGMLTDPTGVVPTRMEIVNALDGALMTFESVNVTRSSSPGFAVDALRRTLLARSDAQTPDDTVIVTPFDVADAPEFPARS